MQKILVLSGEMIRYIEAKRDWVRNHYIENAITEYATIAGKFKLLDIILKSDWIESHETVKLQNLGITLGDIFVQDMKFVWVEVQDEYGTDPALQLPNTSLLLFPLTMISKRIETGQKINIYEFYEVLKNKVNEIGS